MACQLGWSHGMAVLAVGEAPVPSPVLRRDQRRGVGDGRSWSGAVGACAARVSHLGPALQIQPGLD